MYKAADNLLVWATDIEQDTIDQAARTARLPFLAGPVALMPDAHVGIGATVGSVIATKGAVIPAAIGVDIGCGMIATKTSLWDVDLPDSLDGVMGKIERRVPAGLGRAHAELHNSELFVGVGVPHTPLSTSQMDTANAQFGTLGSGNHFVEICLDDEGHVWTVLHSGSRGIGNQLARRHIEGAKKLMKQYFIQLEDPDLAYFVQGTPEFTAYIDDMLWAQRYAFASRTQMNAAVTGALFEEIGHGEAVQEINCHHNFTQREHRHGQDVWVTRKGAIQADEGTWGIIPGSMGTDTFVVTGLGSEAAYASCSHGAGRRMSRGRARALLSAQSLTEAMKGQCWQAADAGQLVDEHPAAYKDIGQVMIDQKDLCQVRYVLRSVLNYKGTK